MAPNSLSSEDFSFPLLASQDSSQISDSDTPPLWKYSPENILRGDDGRSILGKCDDEDRRKSFSYVERRSSLGSVIAEEKMDMLWEYFNEELLPTRSQSLRNEPGESSVVFVERGMKLTKTKKKKMSTNVLMLMRVLKKILVMRRSLSQRSLAKTHPQ
ncbi:unnamed protein product [Eruca vesicaria subsp. sativa]|uniref:Uncharacterized protein n=1 Tax=Eruca vesicaria subsp. sativa TaxID=29727 RepID=A0ABC8JME2_ERUVS|nr:unnamed protein product [Eruca vesicaria subsp. sativa]